VNRTAAQRRVAPVGARVCAPQCAPPLSGHTAALPTSSDCDSCCQHSSAAISCVHLACARRLVQKGQRKPRHNSLQFATSTMLSDAAIQFACLSVTRNARMLYMLPCACGLVVSAIARDDRQLLRQTRQAAGTCASAPCALVRLHRVLAVSASSPAHVQCELVLLKGCRRSTA
jgi:hypothetical protein